MRACFQAAAVGAAMMTTIASTAGALAQAPSEAKLLASLKSASDKQLPSLIGRAADVTDRSSALTERLLELLGHEDLAVRRAAAMTVGKISRDKATQQALIALLKGTEGARQGEPLWLAAAQGLSFMGSEVNPQLVRLLDDMSLRVQRAALVALHDQAEAPTKATPKIIEVLKRDDDTTRVAAIATLRRIGPGAKDALPELVRMLEHKDFHTQYWSCRALGALKKEAKPALPALRERLANGGPTVRGNAALALGAIGSVGGRASVDALIAALDDPLYSVKERTLKALVLFGADAKPATEKVLVHLRGSTPELRAHAARVLAGMDAHVEESIKVLVNELQDLQCPWVAAEHLGTLGDRARPAIPALRAALRSELPESQLYAAQALGELGATEALDDLEQLTEVGAVDVAAAASRAIAAIRAKPGDDERPEETPKKKKQ